MAVKETNQKLPKTASLDFYFYWLYLKAAQQNVSSNLNQNFQLF